jgi:hypothetical protein
MDGGHKACLVSLWARDAEILFQQKAKERKREEKTSYDLQGKGKILISLNEIK